ncbi:MAG: 8-amino-7-oxononanoate synthase [Bacteroidales bacterium]|nr:8-amino-7-oxononanoate synthase [Bacteroidales bacterium]
MIDFEKQLDALSSAGCLRTLSTADTSLMINLSTNDYMGLADDASLVDEFLGQYSPLTRSMSASSSRLLTGNHAEYSALEAQLSELYGGRAALVFNCGYHANSGVLPALADKDDIIIADKLIHASLIDGMRLAAANGTAVVRFNHNDTAHLRRILEKRRGSSGRAFVVVESIYSMDGDTAPLHELVELKAEFGFWLYVDEAHAVGARGDGGAGLMAELGLASQADIIVGTCGKALASCGAWVVSSPLVRQWLVNRCRTLIFTTGLPPVNVAWTRFVLRKLQTMDRQRLHLKNLGEWLTKSLHCDIPKGGATHIVPYICGENSAAAALAQKLRDAGFYVLPIRHPTVPLHTARLRLSLKANMEKRRLAPLIDILNQN